MDESSLILAGLMGLGFYVVFSDDDDENGGGSLDPQALALAAASDQALAQAAVDEREVRGETTTTAIDSVIDGVTNIIGMFAGGG